MDKNFRSKEAQWTSRMNNMKKITLKHYNQMFKTTNKEKILKSARGKKTKQKGANMRVTDFSSETMQAKRE